MEVRLYETRISFQIASSFTGRLYGHYSETVSVPTLCQAPENIKCQSLSNCRRQDLLLLVFTLSPKLSHFGDIWSPNHLALRSNMLKLDIKWREYNFYICYIFLPYKFRNVKKRSFSSGSRFHHQEITVLQPLPPL